MTARRTTDDVPLCESLSSESVSTRASSEGSNFTLAPTKLSELMRCRGSDAIRAINGHGGVNDILRALQTSATKGISGNPADLQRRQSWYGANKIKPKPQKSYFVYVWEALLDVTLILLLLAAALSIGLAFIPSGSACAADFCQKPASGWTEGAGIIVAVFVIVNVTAISDWHNGREFHRLRSQLKSDRSYDVIRGGEVKKIKAEYIVVGDICQLREGDLSPADGVLIRCDCLKVNEASLTGESEPVRKSTEKEPLLLAGTHIAEGSCTMVVTAVGDRSLIGTCLKQTTAANLKNNCCGPAEDFSMASASHHMKYQSVVQAKLSRMATHIGYAGVTVAVGTFIVLIIRWSVAEFWIKNTTWDNGKHIKSIVDFFITALTVLVVAVPQGLPVAVAFPLAHSVRKMNSDKTLVRRLCACATMGNVTAICCDKTGMLTESRMTVTQSYIGGVHQDVAPLFNDLPQTTAQLLVQAISINSDYTSLVMPASKPGERPKQEGDETDCALLGFLLDLGQDYGPVRQQHPVESHFKQYNSARNCVSTVIKLPEKQYRLFAKGTSKAVLQKCTYALDDQGLAQELTSADAGAITSTVVDPMVREGSRPIVLAYKDFVKGKGAKKNDAQLTKSIDWANEEKIVNGLTFIGIFGIGRPVRKEVPDAIETCRRAGITVRLVTSDTPDVARSVAVRCGILGPNDDFLALNTGEFNRQIRDDAGEVSQELLDKVWPKLRVLARCPPSDVCNLVTGIINSNLNSSREVVAVTGARANEVSALKAADVGLALGIVGTDLAKESSDIILADDNFSSVVKAVMWGRNVIESIAKLVQFQLTVNIVAVLLAFICAAAIKESPLKAVQMLWISLIMDPLASLALATESPTPDLLDRKSYGRTKPLVSTRMLLNIIGHSAYQFAVVFGLVFGAPTWLDIDSAFDLEHPEPTQHFTIVFNTFVIMTLFNKVGSRKIHGERNVFKGLSKNRILIGILFGTLAGQIILVFFGSNVIMTAQLTLEQWFWCLFFGAGDFLWTQVVITLPTRRLFGGSGTTLAQDDIDKPVELQHEDSLTKKRCHASPQVLAVRSMRRLVQQTRVQNDRAQIYTQD